MPQGEVLRDASAAGRLRETTPPRERPDLETGVRKKQFTSMTTLAPSQVLGSEPAFYEKPAAGYPTEEEFEQLIGFRTAEEKVDGQPD